MKNFIIMIFCISMPFLSSCISINPSIKDVRTNEDSYLNNLIQISGTVTDVQKFPFRKDGIYRIFDMENDSIWIYKKKGLFPKRGDKVSVTGKLRKKDDFRKRLLGPVIIEKYISK